MLLLILSQKDHFIRVIVSNALSPFVLAASRCPQTNALPAGSVVTGQAPQSVQPANTETRAVLRPTQPVSNGSIEPRHKAAAQRLEKDEYDNSVCLPSMGFDSELHALEDSYEFSESSKSITVKG